MPTATISREDIAAAVKDILLGEKHDVASGNPPTTGYVHGPGGLLSYPGVDPDIYSTIVGNLPGLISNIPTSPSVYMNPTFEVITGVQAGSGAEKNLVCDVAPVGGVMKAGIFTLPFGRYERRTREIEINRLGQRNDRADPVDLRLLNSPTMRSPFSDGSGPGSDVLVNEFSTIMFERAVEFHRLLSRQIWRGNPANNAAGGGYKEMAGLELLVNTNWKDAITGTALPSLYPLVSTFGLKLASAFGTDLVNALTSMMFQLRDLEDRTGIGPVRWALVMRPMAFYEVTKVWPCAYMTTVCSVPASPANQYQQVISVSDQIAMRDDMRNNRYLIFDGQRVDVILDDGITEYSNTTKAGVTSGCFSSDIFIIPLSVLGGRAVTYFEYFQFQNPSIEAALNGNMVLARPTAGGMFMETILQTVWCTQWQAKIEPRLIFRTPWLSARLTNVQYCPIQQPRDAYPSSPYWVNGGETTRPGPSLYNPWA